MSEINNTELEGNNPTVSSIDAFEEARLKEETDQIKMEHDIEKKKLQKSAFLYFFIGILFFLSLIAFYIIPKYLELNNVITQIGNFNDDIEIKTKERDEIEKELATLEIKKKEVEAKFGNIVPKILPEVYTEAQMQERINLLATFFEDLSLEYHNEVSNPLLIPSVDFGKPYEDENNNVFVLPIKMTVEAGAKNFNLFLRAIDSKSGSIEVEDFYYSTYSKSTEPIPVMTIDSLTLSFPEEERAVTTLLSSLDSKKEKDSYVFSVSISAYFQATDEMKEMFGKGK